MTQQHLTPTIVLVSKNEPLLMDLTLAPTSLTKGIKYLEPMPRFKITSLVVLLNFWLSMMQSAQTRKA